MLDATAYDTDVADFQGALSAIANANLAPLHDLLFAGPMTLEGSAGSDWLIGDKFADHLNGHGGADLLSGGNGGDVILGGNGHDDLAGGNGKDVLNGGAGAGELGAAKFHIGEHAHDGSDRIIYNDQTGALYYDPDGKGGVSQVKFAELDAGLKLSHSDFSVYNVLSL